MSSRYRRGDRVRINYKSIDPHVNDIAYVGYIGVVREIDTNHKMHLVDQYGVVHPNPCGPITVQFERWIEVVQGWLTQAGRFYSYQLSDPLVRNCPVKGVNGTDW